MNTTTYYINKNINKPIEFKGLKAQYIWWLGGGLVFLLVLFALLYCCGVNTFICLGIVTTTGGVLFFYVYRVSKKFGEHGMMKALARKRVPKVVKSSTRKVFTEMYGKRHCGKMRFCKN